MGKIFNFAIQNFCQTSIWSKNLKKIYLGCHAPYWEFRHFGAWIPGLTANSLNYGNLEWGRHENETLLTLYEIINIYFSETVPWELKTHRRLYNSLILICYYIYSKIYKIYSYQYLFQSFLIFNIHYIYKNKNICWQGFILNNEF